jgi:serine/threonine protein kinase/tetratricopeptide (TPR) repeat protein
MNESPNQAVAIRDGALQLPAEARAAYLQSACGNDADLHARVTALLQAHENAATFPQESAQPGGNKTIVLSLTPDEKPGDRIGRYKLLQSIGEGGCGVVYMAEQEEPVRRRVALKVIKLGMDTKSVIARFEAERQALAMMDHPNIAKVLDAGATEIGRPFFVMELVRGIKITDYCDQNKLSTPERLQLFIQVCNAIQHAHQKGIIHRDIKPSNILVTLHDGVPVPKVIDFGIAKATQGRLTDQTLFTAFEQFIGTPAYMSPEQAEMSGLDIDTRSDIYALGVLLYELLTGRTPFDAKELLQSGLDELRRTIREKEPIRPSTRLSTMLAADLTSVALQRRAEAPKLIHLLRGDVDWIVMKALEKDRTRRYETANGLAADVQRYLSNEPVTARPPSTVYRFQKLVRRNKTIFVAGSAGMVALVLGLILSLYLYAQQRSALKRAIAAEHKEKQLREQAEQSAAWSKEIGRAELLLMHEQYVEAERVMDQVPPHASLVALYSVFGSVHARSGRWAQAATNYARVAEFAPSEHGAFEALAALAIKMGDEEQYRHWREAILRQFETTRDPAIAAALAAECLAMAPPTTDLERIGKMVEAGLANSAKREDVAYGQLVKGLFEYRRGHFTEAKEWLQKALASPEALDDWNRAVQGEMILAMAQYQLKEIEAARGQLGMGLQMADSKLAKPGSDLHDSWASWLLAQWTMREATTMIPEVTAANNNMAKLVAEEPAWQISLRQAGVKFTSQRQDDGTWELNMDDQPVTDLSVLRGASLSRLSLMHTPVAELGALRGMSLKWLRLAGTKVGDLSPLRGMPLESLQISGTPVIDLTPLGGMPLRALNMTGCTGITNLEPIANIKTFQSVILPPRAVGIEFLRGLTNLTRISFKYDSVLKGPAQSAAEFWAEFDLGKSRQTAGGL